MEKKLKAIRQDASYDVETPQYSQCAQYGCKSTATALLFGKISLCPTHAHSWFMTWHEEEKEKLAGDAIFAMQKQTRAIEQATIAITDLQNKLAHKEKMEEILYDIIKDSVPLHSKIIAKVKQIFAKKGVLII